MRQLDGARLAVLAILAGAAGTATAGAAMLVRAGAGLCGHRLFASHAMTMPSGTMAGGLMDHGMALALPGPAADGICPILLALGLIAAALCLLVLVVLLASAGRLVAALVAAFRLLVPGADTPWAPRRALVPIPAGVRLGRRRPSRAPPLRA
ncbi:MAG: hypothetical protein QOI11_3811 [Candidatus Eremiobacteraeota bacterium]|jgi:hypothetical protein|nr:hypothetical protein [Candidatus Eremiobacteraeota bacterium]